MAKFKVTFKKSITKDFRSIPKQDVSRILKRINLLTENPRGDGCIKLSGQETYRVRQGLYRIIYEIKDHLLVVQIIKIGHRPDVYKNN